MLAAAVFGLSRVCDAVKSNALDVSCVLGRLLNFENVELKSFATPGEIIIDF